MGKSAGMVAVWTSPSFSSMTALQGMTDGGGLCSARLGSSTVVGLAWTAPPVQGQEPAVVLTAAGQDGSLASWRVAGQVVCPKCPHFTLQKHRKPLNIRRSSPVCILSREFLDELKILASVGSLLALAGCMYMAAVLCSCSHVGALRRCQAARPACTLR